ncbi:MAG: aminopeptidase [Oceanotoga sp.]|uniref:M42 family metallopeptidase n=1 Tax=Oceanotoga sp. TaxID=2108366 RepID=UPI00264E3DA8|nr:M42 family metallopeptidase [Oceanotoga sp.]MDN5341504.1 aminopeptidase [Oceanotoga sp.]
MEKYIDYSIDKIIELCKTPSPTGFTKKAIKKLEKIFKEIGYEYNITNKGSLIVDLGGEGNAVAFAAHIDTLGAMVRSIKDNGRIRLTRLGGFPLNFVETENCIIHTRDLKEYSGTIQVIHPAVHVYSDAGSMKREEQNMELIIDEKVFNKEDVQKLGIQTGDFVSFDSRSVYTESGFIKSRHLDDKASAGILIGISKYIKENNIKLNRKVYIIFTTYEEVGHGGSFVPADIKEMISVDMGAVGEDLETNEFKVSICSKDSGGPYDYEVTTDLINIAKKLDLNYAIDVYPYYGSDVEATLRAGYDIKHALIGPGVFASHGYERTHKEGIENTFKLILDYISK